MSGVKNKIKMCYKRVFLGFRNDTFARKTNSNFRFKKRTRHPLRL